MQYFTFEPSITRVMPILSETKLILTNDVDYRMVQSTIILDLLPLISSMFETKVRLILVTITIIKYVAYWDLLFEFPEYDKALPILDKITQNAYNLEDTYDFITLNNTNIYKLSFKAG